MKEDHRNTLTAIILSGAIIFGFQYYISWRYGEEPAPVPSSPDMVGGERSIPGPGAPIPGAPPAPGVVPGFTVPTVPASRPAPLPEEMRAALNSADLAIGVRLRGSRIDSLILNNYREKVSTESAPTRLLSPGGVIPPYFAETGWAASQDTQTPDQDTIWREEKGPDNVIILHWRGDNGLAIERRITLEADYILAITDTLHNDSSSGLTLSPYGRIVREGKPETSQFWILHEGLIGVLNEDLIEVDYDDIEEDKKNDFSSRGGWLGVTDKYWLVALLADRDMPIKARFLYTAQQNRYQTDYIGEPVTIGPGGTHRFTSRLFAGPKRLKDLDAQGERLGLPLFDRAIDFGWFYFLTKPLSQALSFLGEYLGNFGFAILALTVGIRICLFPLANRSYRSMAGMRRLQPEVAKLKERFGGDRAKMQQAMMELYKREKVDPFSGCLPILLQIPIFFSLYKVLFVTIEIRHAPFFWWIQDLSAGDPTTIWNLFGLIPWTPPELFSTGILGIGALPLLMGFSMYVQQKLNPTPPDPIQARVFAMLPILFTFLLARFSTGLVLYWVWNNILSITQQYVIMRRAGVRVSWGKTQAPS